MTFINSTIKVSAEEIKDFLMNKIQSPNLERIINHIKKQDPNISSHEALEIYLDFLECNS